MELTQMVTVIVATGCSTAVVLALVRSIDIRIKLRRPPEEVLARRFAAGELTETEYLTKLELLHESRTLAP